jgi:hypothetical protein
MDAHAAGSAIALDSDMTVFPRGSDTSLLDCIRWRRMERVANALMRFYCEHSISSAHVTDIANDQSGFTDDAAFGAR